MKMTQKKNMFLVGVGSFFLSFMSGCAKEVRRPLSIMDTPEHHYANGMKLFNREEYDKAGKSFTKAKELDPEFAPAYVGFALIEVHKKNFPNARENLEEAWSNANTDDHKVLVQIGRIRVISEERPEEDWIEDAEDYFDKGKDYDEKSPGLFYFMGIAYKRAYDFDKAGNMFREVLEFNTKYVIEADHEWSLVQKIQR